MLAGWERDLRAAWRKVLGGTELNWRSPALDYDLRPGEIVLPGRKGNHVPGAPEHAHVFRAFDHTDSDAVRAVILGQDPYANPAWATGRAFEQGNLAEWPEDPQKVAASLRRIVLAIAAARTGDSSYTAGDRAWKKLLADARRGLIQLEPPRELFDRLEREGVLFLNTSLTVGVRTARNGSKQCRRHFPLWAPLIDRVLTYLAGRASGCAIFLLLGRHAEAIFDASGARRAAECAGNWKNRVDAVRHFHPAAITAQGAVFLRPPNPFRAANNLLERMGAAPVSW
jgi:uracil-DNA glycosylase